MNESVLSLIHSNREDRDVRAMTKRQRLMLNGAVTDILVGSNGNTQVAVSKIVKLLEQDDAEILTTAEAQRIKASQFLRDKIEEYTESLSELSTPI